MPKRCSYGSSCSTLFNPHTIVYFLVFVAASLARLLLWFTSTVYTRVRTRGPFSFYILRFTDTLLLPGLAEQMKGVLVMARRTLKLFAGGNEDGCVVN